MKSLKFLKGLFSKSTPHKKSKMSDIKKNTENYKCLDPDKIELLLKKYNCELKEDLVIVLKERELKHEEFTEDEKIFYNDPEYDCVKSIAELGFIIHRENLYGRSLAITELVENHYQIRSVESGNPSKELINFTLHYFDKYFSEKPIEAEKLLRDSFPTMHLYIKRQISNEQNEINNNVEFDDQDAYDEFLFFCKKTFCSLYPDKSIRDEQIRHHFKIHVKDLIRYIDSEESN
jgi:hypothetical protein